jgi:hypothetical protein
VVERRELARHFRAKTNKHVGQRGGASLSLLAFRMPYVHLVLINKKTGPQADGRRGRGR